MKQVTIKKTNVVSLKKLKQQLAKAKRKKVVSNNNHYDDDNKEVA